MRRADRRLTRLTSWGAIHLAFSLYGLSPTEATDAAATVFAATQRTAHLTVFWAVDRTGITEIHGAFHAWNGDR